MEQRVKITSLDTARLTCPECRRSKLIQLSEYRLTKRLSHVRFTCSCGHVYQVILEKKLGSNKETHLAGTFVDQQDNRNAGRMVVTHVTADGVTLRTDLGRPVMPGNVVAVEFVLDDVKQSVIQREAKVLASSKKYMTAEFLDKERQDDLASYLAFNDSSN